MRTTGCGVFQEERVWPALLRAARGQGLEASFETNGSIALQVSVRNLRKAEAAVVMRLRSHSRPYKLLHDLVGDRMRMAARKGKGVTSSEQRDGLEHLCRGFSEGDEGDGARQGKKKWRLDHKAESHRAKTVIHLLKEQWWSPAVPSSLGRREKP